MKVGTDGWGMLTCVVELAVIIGARAKRISASNAWDHVAGYALALDMTARTLQRQAIASGTPWTVSKGFDTFTPIGEFIPKSRIPNPDNLILWCKVDGEMKQWGKTSDMVFKYESQPQNNIQNSAID